MRNFFFLLLYSAILLISSDAFAQEKEKEKKQDTTQTKLVKNNLPLPAKKKILLFIKILKNLVKKASLEDSYIMLFLNEQA